VNKLAETSIDPKRTAKKAQKNPIEVGKDLKKDKKNDMIDSELDEPERKI